MFEEFSHAVGQKVKYDGKDFRVVSHILMADNSRFYNIEPWEKPEEGDEPPLPVPALALET